MTESYRVLIVDDHELAISGIALALSERPHYAVVGILNSGKQVAREIERLQVDIVLLDLNLPDITGLDVLIEAVGTLNANVIILSGENNPQDFRFALDAGARGVVSKSDPVKTIVQALDAVVAGEQFVSPQIQALIGGVEGKAISLSPRQLAILHFLAAGETNKEISYRLSISPPTVSFHLRELRRKLGVAGNKKILNRATELGLLTTQ